MGGAQWYSTDLSPIKALRPGLEAVSSVAALLTPAVSAIRIGTAAVPQLVDAAALLADAAARELAQRLIGSMTDVLFTGIYMLPVYPLRVDFNAARLAEVEAAAAQRLRQAKETYRDTLALPPAARGRNTVQSAKTALDAAEAEWRAARRDGLFSGAGPLAGAAFPYGSFLATVRDSIADTGDKQRPLFTQDAICGAVVVVVGANSLAELLTAVAALGAWATTPGLQRLRGNLSRLLDASAARDAPSPFGLPQEAPDWQSISLLGALGLESQVLALRRAAASVGLGTLIGESPTTSAVLAYLDDLASAIEEAGTLADTALRALTALGALNLKTYALVVPPADGARDIGGGVQIPNYTAGVEGVLTALQAADNAPTETWTVGMVLLAGTAGVGIQTLPQDLSGLAAARTASGEVEKIVGVFREALPPR